MVKVLPVNDEIPIVLAFNVDTLRESDVIVPPVIVENRVLFAFKDETFVVDTVMVEPFKVEKFSEPTFNEDT